MRGYEPVQHTGTREERILGLMREWCDVGGGLIRLHATTRERVRIEGELAALGAEVYEGDGADEGWLLGREIAAPHKPECGVRNLGEINEHVVCVCDHYPWRVWEDPGFDDGVGREVEVQDYALVPVDEAQRMGVVTAGMTQCSYGGDGVWLVPVVVGSHKEWIGPPRKTFSSESG